MAIAPNSTPARRTAELLIGRVSVPGARYFITLCEKDRRPGLTSPRVAERLKFALGELHTSGDFSVVAASAMPDHVHFVGHLGVRLSLSRGIGRLKTATRSALAHAALSWQENYYDHRLRPDEDVEAYARYVFLNPYRARLVKNDEPWPCWWRWGAVPFVFEKACSLNGGVPVEWLDEPGPPGACAP